MAIAVDFGTLIVGVIALLITFNPQIAKLFNWLHWKGHALLRLEEVQCEQFLWEDLSNALHSHQFPPLSTMCTLCTQAQTHAQESSCWTSTVALAFNNGWTNRRRRSAARKPAELPLNQKFLRTDAKVVLGNFFSNARINEFKDEMLSNSLRFVDFDKRERFVIAHVGRAGKFIDLTVEEVERILDGWPPFYRATFQTHEGHVLRPPLKEFDHFRRPSWIIAIGLGRAQPTDIFVDNSPDRSLFSYALDRVLKLLKRQFKATWPHHQELARATAIIENMLVNGRSMEHDLLLELEKDNHMGTVAYPSLQSVGNHGHLTQVQCEALLRVFHDLNVNGNDRTILEPVLEICVTRHTSEVRPEYMEGQAKMPST